MTVTVDKRYLDILSPLDDANHVVQQALAQYAITLISAKISAMMQKKRDYEEKFALSFDDFSMQITTNTDFVDALEQEHPNWESDFLDWEFSVKSIKDWKKKLETILTI